MTVPQAHPPGDEAEVDFGEATVVIAGVPVKVEIFHLRLSHSARPVHIAFASEGQASVIRRAAAGRPPEGDLSVRVAWWVCREQLGPRGRRRRRSTEGA
ncbi:MAG: hypothetical protein WEE50_06550 [Chloroflexota bacterium]